MKIVISYPQFSFITSIILGVNTVMHYGQNLTSCEWTVVADSQLNANYQASV